MFQQNNALLFGSDNLIAVDAASFDGTNDYMTRGAGLTGAADSKKGIISFWIKIDGGDATDMTIFHGATTLAGSISHFRVRRTAANHMEIVAFNAAGSTLFTITSVATVITSSTWKNFLASWDCSIPTASLYINDSLDAIAVPTNDIINYVVADWAIGAQANGGTRTNAGLAEFYFQPGVYLDFSQVTNRRKFISYSRKPVTLGANGSFPTGTPALVYEHLSDGEAAADFATNRGTGGNFTITGTLTTEATSPSD